MRYLFIARQKKNVDAFQDVLVRLLDGGHAVTVAVQEEIKRVLNTIAREAPPPGRSFGVAEEYVKLMKGLNELDDAAVYSFAE